MGRSPCCDKVGLKKGPWTPEEDQKLLAYIEEHGHGSWRALPAKAGLQRCGKSCRLRWTNYLRPDIKRGKFSIQEEQTIIQLHALLGNRWSAIATHLPKRTDNEIKNYWNTHLKKRLAKMGIDPVTHKPKNDAILSSHGQSKNAANLSHMAQWESARLEAEARLARQSKLRSNSFHNQPEFMSAPSSPLSKAPPPQAPPGRCLDILKAWNGAIWAKSLDIPVESPTSTVSYSENNAPQMSSTNAAFMEFVGNNSSGTTSCDGSGMLKEDGEEDWKGLQDLTMPMDNCPAWAEGGGDDHRGSFVETFTDLLLNNADGSGGERGFPEGCGESENAASVAAPEAAAVPGSEYLVDNKNYWNSILNLVNSSPCDDSPMF